MAEAIFGLVGVLIGGLLTAGIAEAQRRAAGRRGSRFAARAIISELVSMAASVALAQAEGSVEHVDSPDELVRVWRAHRGELDISCDDWSTIDDAVVAAMTFPRAELLDDSTDEELAAELTSAYDQLIEGLDAATRVLAKHAG